MTSAFKDFDGFVEARIAKDKTGQKISFVDFASTQSAINAMKQMRGYKFLGSTKGLNLRISDKSQKLNKVEGDGRSRERT